MKRENHDTPHHATSVNCLCLLQSLQVEIENQETCHHVSGVNCLPVFVLQSLQVEIENHENRIMSVVQVGQDLIDEGHPQSEEFRALIEDLLQRWQELKDAVEARSQRLKLSEIAQQVRDNTLNPLWEFHEKLLKISGISMIVFV